MNKPFDLHLDPPSSENLPLCRITQDGKDPTITTDFYLTNMEPREWILPTPPTNNKVATSNSAAAASNLPPEKPADSLQPGEIQLHSWQLYTPEAPVLDLRGKKVTSTLDLLMLFTSYVYVQQTVINMKNLYQMAEGKGEKPTNLNKELSDSDTSDEEPINPKLTTSIEEGHYGTIPGLVLATQAALSHTCAKQALLRRVDPAIHKQLKS